MATATFDRPAIFRAAWRIARDAAARTGEAVRLFIGNSLRMAWRRARADRATAASITARRQVVVAAGMVCELHPRGAWKAGFGATLTPDGRPSCTTVNNEEQAVELCEEALANYRASQSSAPSPAPEQPDVSTRKGLAQVLVGRTATLELSGGEAVYTVTEVSRWMSPDGAHIHDYIRLSSFGQFSDNRKGPVSLFILRKGYGRGTYVDTAAGCAFWGYGTFCDSNSKRGNADRLVKELLDPIL